jgi:hypothetical protein
MHFFWTNIITSYNKKIIILLNNDIIEILKCTTQKNSIWHNFDDTQKGSPILCFHLIMQYNKITIVWCVFFKYQLYGFDIMLFYLYNGFVLYVHGVNVFICFCHYIQNVFQA